MDKIRVLLVDDHPVVREGLRTLLATASDIEVVAEADNGLDAVEKASEHQPHVVLMDLRMPNLDGLEATRRIKCQLAATAVIVLTMYDNEAYIMDAVRAGASGYLLKDASQELLIHTIRVVNNGGMLIKASRWRQAMLSLADATVDESRGKQKSATLSNVLMPRERNVLRLVAHGQSNKEIGHALSIGEDAVKKHVQAILSKLGVSDRTMAAVQAVRAGLVSPFSDKELR